MVLNTCPSAFLTDVCQPKLLDLSWVVCASPVMKSVLVIKVKLPRLS